MSASLYTPDQPLWVELPSGRRYEGLYLFPLHTTHKHAVSVLAHRLMGAQWFTCVVSGEAIRPRAPDDGPAAD